MYLIGLVTWLWQVSLSQLQTQSRALDVSPRWLPWAPGSLLFPWAPISWDPRRLMSCWCGWKEKIGLITCGENVVDYQTFDTSQHQVTSDGDYWLLIGTTNNLSLQKLDSWLLSYDLFIFEEVRELFVNDIRLSWTEVKGGGVRWARENGEYQLQIK